MTGLLRLVSTVATAFIVVGFTLFAVDETREGSAATVTRIADAQGSATERAREENTGWARETVEDVNDVLLAPFDGVVANTDGAWARHGIPAVLGFLLYGLLLRLLANAIPKARHREPLGWEAPR